MAHWVATEEPLFGWFKNNNFTFVVRAVGGALGFDSNGLSVLFIDDDNSFGIVAVASRVRPELKN